MVRGEWHLPKRPIDHFSIAIHVRCAAGWLLPPQSQGWDGGVPIRAPLFHSCIDSIPSFPCSQGKGRSAQYHLICKTNNVDLALCFAESFTGNCNESIHAKPEEVRDVIGRKRRIDILAHRPRGHRLQQRYEGHVVALEDEQLANHRVAFLEILLDLDPVD